MRFQIIRRFIVYVFKKYICEFGLFSTEIRLLTVTPPNSSTMLVNVNVKGEEPPCFSILFTVNMGVNVRS